MNAGPLKARIDAIGLAHLSDRILDLARPCVQLNTTPSRGLPVGATKIGGAPDLPFSVPWPAWQEKPLAFLAQLNCGDFHGTQIAGQLPEAGIISFFYDAEQSTWGYDPKDVGSWVVLFTNSTGPELTRRELPDGIPDHARYRECRVTPREAISLPGWETPQVESLKLSERDMHLYLSLLHEMIERGSRHQLLGYPEELQGDMHRECQLVTNGLYLGDARAWLGDPRIDELERGSVDWRLLFQLDCDEENSGMFWGTSGRLYFWIKSEDLRQRRFDKTWMVLQAT